jgi:hypothetical protein
MKTVNNASTYRVPLWMAAFCAAYCRKDISIEEIKQVNLFMMRFICGEYSDAVRPLLEKSNNAIKAMSAIGAQSVTTKEVKRLVRGKLSVSAQLLAEWNAQMIAAEPTAGTTHKTSPNTVTGFERAESGYSVMNHLLDPSSDQAKMD